MAEGFRIDAAWLDALDNYVDGLLTDTQEAAHVTANYLYEEVVDSAREHPEWVSLSDNISVWSQDGHLAIGVSDLALTSEAFALEYGDENSAPQPLFRTANALVPKVQDRLQDELRSRLGTVIKGMKV